MLLKLSLRCIVKFKVACMCTEVRSYDYCLFFLFSILLLRFKRLLNNLDIFHSKKLAIATTISIVLITKPISISNFRTSLYFYGHFVQCVRL